MSRAAYLAASLVLAAVALTPSEGAAWCRMTTSLRSPTAAEPCVLPDPSTDPPEQFLAWQRPCTSLTLSEVAPSSDLLEAEVLGALQRSINTWEEVQCGGQPVGLQLGILEARNTCDDALYRDDGGNTNQLMFVQDWARRDFDAGAFALTIVWHRRSTGEILDADVVINEQRGPYAICPAAGCVAERGVDLENVLTHELGHYFGIAHSTVTDATMFVSAVAGETIKRDLDADDVAALCEIYPPGTFADAQCDFQPRGGLDLDCEEGCSVSGVGRSAPAWALGLLALAAVALTRRRLRG